MKRKKAWASMRMRVGVKYMFLIFYCSFSYFINDVKPLKKSEYRNKKPKPSIMHIKPLLFKEVLNLHQSL